jgi:hypothetical protein
MSQSGSPTAGRGAVVVGQVPMAMAQPRGGAADGPVDGRGQLRFFRYFLLVYLIPTCAPACRWWDQPGPSEFWVMSPFLIRS